MPDERAGPGVTHRSAAFDGDHPPAAALIKDCVHCGFCLPTCPTYVLWGEEMDSPRGRIHLMAQALDGAALTPTMVGHFDACLGCMACVSACPSGVRYDRLIENTRAQIERRYPRPRRERLLRAAIFAVFPHRRRLRWLRAPLRAYQATVLPELLRRSGWLQRRAPRLATMEALAPPLGEREDLPALTRAQGERRGVVGLLRGCVQGELFPQVGAATARVLAAEGFDVVAPLAQGCCGALSAHNGRRPEAARYARRLIDEFERSGVEWIVVNAAGCGSTMKEYTDLLEDDPAYAAKAQRFSAMVRDVTELLDEQGTVAPRHRLPVTVAYHDACHLAHAQGVRTQPRRLLAAVPGLELIEIDQPELCCGSAGIYNLLAPEPAGELGDRKAANVVATGAALLVTANPGCSMQIAAALRRKGQAMPALHTVEVLDASIAGRPVASLLAPRR